MSVFPLNIEKKEDHPDKVAALIGVLTKYYLKDDEINKISDALTELNNRSIKISQSHYALSRTPTNSELTEGLGIGDVITNGMLTDDILITRARWANTLGDNDITNFGTYANKYKDGNYTNVTFTKF